MMGSSAPRYIFPYTLAAVPGFFSPETDDESPAETTPDVDVESDIGPPLVIGEAAFNCQYARDPTSGDILRVSICDMAEAFRPKWVSGVIGG